MNHTIDLESFNNLISIISVVDESLDKVVLAVNVNTGSDNEITPGVAHLLEHMIFMGSSRYPTENQLDETVSKMGGYSNAYTEDHQTVYYIEVPINKTPEVPDISDNKAQVECNKADSSINKTNGDKIDISNNKTQVVDDNYKELFDIFLSSIFSPLLTKDAFNREINSVESEYLNSLNNSYFIEEAIYNEINNLNKFTMGNKETLKNAYNEVIAYYNNHYKNSKISIVVSSNKEMKEILKGILKEILKANLKEIDLDKGKSDKLENEISRGKLDKLENNNLLDNNCNTFQVPVYCAQSKDPFHKFIFYIPIVHYDINLLDFIKFHFDDFLPKLKLVHTIEIEYDKNKMKISLLISDHIINEDINLKMDEEVDSNKFKNIIFKIMENILNNLISPSSQYHNYNYYNYKLELKKIFNLKYNEIALDICSIVNDIEFKYLLNRKSISINELFYIKKLFDIYNSKIIITSQYFTKDVFNSNKLQIKREKYYKGEFFKSDFTICHKIHVKQEEFNLNNSFLQIYFENSKIIKKQYNLIFLNKLTNLLIDYPSGNFKTYILYFSNYSNFVLIYLYSIVDKFNCEMTFCKLEIVKGKEIKLILRGFEEFIEFELNLLKALLDRNLNSQLEKILNSNLDSQLSIKLAIKLAIDRFKKEKIKNKELSELAMDRFYKYVDCNLEKKLIRRMICISGNWPKSNQDGENVKSKCKKSQNGKSAVEESECEKSKTSKNENYFDQECIVQEINDDFPIVIDEIDGAIKSMFDYLDCDACNKTFSCSRNCNGPFKCELTGLENDESHKNELHKLHKNELHKSHKNESDITMNVKLPFKSKNCNEFIILRFYKIPIEYLHLGLLYVAIKSEDFYNQLRTKEQLGYIVDLSIKYCNGEYFILFRVQSSKSIKEIRERIDEFINNNPKIINDEVGDEGLGDDEVDEGSLVDDGLIDDGQVALDNVDDCVDVDDEDWMEYKNSLINNLKIKPTNIYEAMDEVEDIFINKNNDKNYKKKLIEKIEKTKKEEIKRELLFKEVIEVYNENIENNWN